MLNPIHILASLMVSNSQVMPSVGVIRFALRWVVTTYGQQVGGTMDASQLSHTTDWFIYLVCRSLSQTSEKLCMGLGPPNLTQNVSKG